jgi:RHS repeat-associated protein
MDLLYEQTDANLGNTGRYDGNISAVKWMTLDAANVKINERSYKYSYNLLNRLTASSYAERGSTSTGSFNVNVNGFNEDNITYDVNGNILTLRRNSSTIGASSNMQVDDLTYTYDTTNPNRLKTVTDGTGANYTSYGFRNLTGSTGDYGYDSSGNLTADPYKGLTLSYNILNKTDSIIITTATKRYLRYTYNSAGQMIRKQAFDNAVLQKTTDYIDGFVYENSTLTYFAIPEGRVVNVSGTLTPEFVITDQQGNARINFRDNGSGQATITQENSYYAFGLVLANSPINPPAISNKNLYNGGSEWQNDFSNLPDYYQTFFRNYDQALGRFVAVDPLTEAAESLTGYNYSANNPVMFNDPMGDRPPLTTFAEPVPTDGFFSVASSGGSRGGTTVKPGINYNYLTQLGFEAEREGRQIRAAAAAQAAKQNGDQQAALVAKYGAENATPYVLSSDGVWDASILLPTIPIKLFRSGNLPTWWGENQLFLDAHKSWSGETQVANNNTSGVSWGKANDWSTVKNTLTTGIAVNSVLDKSKTIADAARKFLENNKIAKIITNKGIERIGKFTGVTSLLINGSKALDAYRAGDTKATIKYGIYTIGQGAFMMMGPQAELAWNLAELTNDIFFEY